MKKHHKTTAYGSSMRSLLALAMGALLGAGCAAVPYSRVIPQRVLLLIPPWLRSTTPLPLRPCRRPLPRLTTAWARKTCCRSPSLTCPNPKQWPHPE